MTPEAIPYFSSLTTMLDAFNGHDVDGVVAILNENCVINRGDGVSLPGQDSLRGWLTDLFAALPDAKIEINQFVALPGDTVLAEWRLIGTSLGEMPANGDQPAIPPNGCHVDAVGAALLTFDADAQISKVEARSDISTLAGQLGIYALDEPNEAQLNDLGQRYTAAWCAKDAAGVAALFAEEGTMSTNGGVPAVGRAAIEEAVSGFIDTFPDLELIMDDLHVAPENTIFSWRLKGTHAETGKRVHISGFEVWRIGGDGLIGNSNDYYDTAVFDDQVANGAVS